MEIPYSFFFVLIFLTKPLKIKKEFTSWGNGANYPGPGFSLDWGRKDYNCYRMYVSSAIAAAVALVFYCVRLEYLFWWKSWKYL